MAWETPQDWQNLLGLAKTIKVEEGRRLSRELFVKKINNKIKVQVLVGKVQSE